MRRILKRLALKFLDIDWYRSARRNYKEFKEWMDGGFEHYDLDK
jgi:hypothetical protein